MVPVPGIFERGASLCPSFVLFARPSGGFERGVFPGGAGSALCTALVYLPEPGPRHSRLATHVDASWRAGYPSGLLCHILVSLDRVNDSTIGFDFDYLRRLREIFALSYGDCGPLNMQMLEIAGTNDISSALAVVSLGESLG